MELDILVVGGNSFIGSNLCSYLLGRNPGISIMNIDEVRDPRMEEVLGLNGYNGRYFFKEGKTSDLTTFEHYLKVSDVVVNAASVGYSPHFKEAMEMYIKKNIKGARLLADSACRNRVPLLHISNDEVYGSCPFTVQRRDESSPVDPSNSFSTTMAAGERLVSIAGKNSGSPIVIARPCEIIGPNQPASGIVPRTIRALLSNQPPQVRDKGGERYRDWLHVMDLCSALNLLIDSLTGSSGPKKAEGEMNVHSHPGGTVISGTSVGTASPAPPEKSGKRSVLSGVSIFNITAEMRFTITDIVKKTMEIMGSDIPLQESMEEGYKDIGYNPSGKKILYQGWHPRYTDIDDILKSTIEWYKDHANILMASPSTRLMP